MADDKYSKLVLGVDLDGVCADFYRQMREIAAEWLEKDISDLPEEFTSGGGSKTKSTIQVCTDSQ